MEKPRKLTHAEKILRFEIREIIEYVKNGNHLIRYDDALKAVEKALKYEHKHTRT